MKKLLVVAIAALVTTSAFAQKSMIRMYGWDSGMRASSFDFSMKSDDAKEAGKNNRTAINYAYAVTDAIQVGITYVSAESATTGTANSDSAGTTTGISLYWNKEGKVNDTCYFAFHYNMHAASDGSYDFGGEQSIGEDDTATDMVLEYGHRFAVGSAWGFNLAFSPAVSYTMTSYSWDADGADDTKGAAHTALAWNFLKFDVLF